MLYHGFLQNNGIHFGVSLCFFIWYNYVVSLVDFMNYVFNEGQNLSIPKNTKTYIFFQAESGTVNLYVCRMSLKVGGHMPNLVSDVPFHGDGIWRPWIH